MNGNDHCCVGFIQRRGEGCYGAGELEQESRTGVDTGCITTDNTLHLCIMSIMQSYFLPWCDIVPSGCFTPTEPLHDPLKAIHKGMNA